MSRRAWKRRSLRTMGGIASVGAHVGILAFLLWPRPEPSPPAEPPPMTVALMQLPKPTPTAPEPEKKPTPKAVPHPQPTPKPVVHRVAALRQHASPVPSEETTPEPVGPPAELSDAEMAGAASADAGAPGGECDMARRVQAALRKDALVRAAVAQAAAAGTGRALLIWKGDWVQGHGEDGKGLAALREAIAWEVGFSPSACRSQSVRGFIVFSLGGSTRVALGSAAWRWSDLLR